MSQNHSGVPVVYTHSPPAGRYKNQPNTNPEGCYRNVSDEQAQTGAQTGTVVAPTFTEWMLDGIWPDDMMRLDKLARFAKANLSL